MTLALTTITNAIAGLTIAGVTIKDMDEIPNAVTDGMCPILYPEPVNFVTEMEITRMAQIVSATPWNVEYNLTYILLYAPAGSGRGLDLISPTLAKAFVIIDAIMAQVAGISGAVTMYFNGMSQPGPVSDPSGTQFFGCQFTVRVLEMIN
jgi:hypothetical protein